MASLSQKLVLLAGLQFACPLAACLAEPPPVTEAAPEELPEANPPEINATENAVTPENGVEVLSRGPIHEAFAEPVIFNPAPGIVIPKQPPAPVEESPPDQRPEGENIAWIPGYWSWDDERSDFLWISGFFREIPAGRQWIPGYWAQANEGSQWVSGYWDDAKTESAQYLPEAPPESLESGPSTEAPAPDQNWAPGNWVWQQNRYQWRPGYWMPASADWIWVPARYVWTPRGYLFVSGFWDYPVVRRGLLFAPVAFAPTIFERRGFVYSPTVCVDAALLTDALFVRPQYGHYYFGDYYAKNQVAAGVYPWFDFHSRRVGYDPIYAYYRSQHRDRGWDQRLRENFAYRQQHVDARPAHFFGRDHGTRNLNRVALVKPLAAYAGGKGNSPVRLQRISIDQRRQISVKAREFRSFAGQRNQLENRTGQAGAPRVRDPKQGVPSSNIPRALKSPIISRVQSQPGRILPSHPTEPKPDPRVLPAPRNPRGDTKKPTLPNPRAGEPKSLPNKNPAQFTPKEVRPLVPPKGNSGPAKPQPPKVLPKVEPQPKGPPQQPKIAPQVPKTQPQLPRALPQPPKVQPQLPKALPAPQPKQIVPPKALPQPVPRAPEIKPQPRPAPQVPKVAPQPPKATPQPIKPPPQAPAVKPPGKPSMPAPKGPPRPAPKGPPRPAPKGPPRKDEKKNP